MSPGNTGFLKNLDLGDMPFLTKLDIRNTEILTVNSSKCPRMETVHAEGTSLSAITFAETSPIREVALPGTITELVLNNLPNLTYPGGLTLEGVNKVTKIFVNECPYIDTMNLLELVIKASELKAVRIPNINASASVKMLRSIKDSGAIGLDSNGNAYDERGKCSGITGRWILDELIETDELKELSAYFPQLNLHLSLIHI